MIKPYPQIMSIYDLPVVKSVVDRGLNRSSFIGLKDKGELAVKIAAIYNFLEEYKGDLVLCSRVVPMEEGVKEYVEIDRGKGNILLPVVSKRYEFSGISNGSGSLMISSSTNYAKKYRLSLDQEISTFYFNEDIKRTFSKKIDKKSFHLAAHEFLENFSLFYGMNGKSSDIYKLNTKNNLLLSCTLEDLSVESEFPDIQESYMIFGRNAILEFSKEKGMKPLERIVESNFKQNDQNLS